MWNFNENLYSLSLSLSLNVILPRSIVLRFYVFFEILSLSLSLSLKFENMMMNLCMVDDVQ